MAFGKRDRAGYGKVLLGLYAILLLLMNLMRCWDNAVWGDEGYSVRLARLSFSGMLAETAEDVHPPLYYMLLQVFERLFGGGWHVATVMTYAVVLVIGLTWIRRRFGCAGAALFLTLASFLESAVTFNVEIRMYSMASMFVLLSFIGLYEILENGGWRDYLLFALFSLGGAYTHYFAILTEAFFYLYLLWDALRRRHEAGVVKKVLVTCAVTVAGYLPWLLVFLQTLSDRLTDGFWLTGIPGIRDCLTYLFDGVLEVPLFLLYVVLVAAVIAARGPWLQGLRAKLPGTQKSSPAEGISAPTAERGRFVTWILVGQFAIFGTMAVSLAVSNLITPLFQVKYLFPASVIAWLSFAACISQFGRWKSAAALVLTAVIIVAYTPSYAATVEKERDRAAQTAVIVEATADISADSCLVTDIDHFSWTVLEYYYPGTENSLVSDLVGAADWEDDEVWLFWSSELEDGNLAILESAGYGVESVAEGYLGSGSETYVYLLTR